MNLFDFYAGSYGFYTGLFAAIFGMSFPLILQCIQRIDEKYDSSVISQVFDNEPSYKLFKVFLFFYIICACASPLLLAKFSANVGVSYIIHCLMLLYILVISVVMVFLFRRITVYYSIEKLVKDLKISNPKIDVLVSFDLAKFASKKGYQEIYIEAMVKVTQCFIIERNKIDKDYPVEYSDGLYRVLLEIGRSLKVMDSELEYRFSDIMSIILDSADEHYISDKTYNHIWFMLNNAASSGNNQWIKDYWTWAVQYYEFKSNKVIEGKYNPEMKKFLHYSVMLGAVLSFNKRYECLSHIMKYSNATNRYPLIPGTFSDIVDIARQINAMLDNPMQIESRFQIAGLNIGVNTDAAIYSEFISYLALLFVRMWSYQNPNINYCNPLSIPSPSDISIDDNETKIRIMGLIRNRVTDLYNSDIINNMGLSFIPQLGTVTNLIDEFINRCNKKSEEIDMRPGYDKEKLRKIYDEVVICNSSSHIPLPSKTELGLRENTETFETIIRASHNVERRFLQAGKTIECGGIGNGLSLNLNLKIRQAFIDYILTKFDVQKETIERTSLSDRLTEMVNDSPKAIIDLSGGIEGIEGTCIYHLGRLWVKDAIFVCDKSCVPTLDIKEVISGSDSTKILDEFNYLYGSIDEKPDCFVVSVMQAISIEVLRDKPKARLIFIK